MSFSPASTPFSLSGAETIAMSPHLRSSPPPPIAPLSIQQDFSRRPEEIGGGARTPLEPLGQTQTPSKEKSVDIHGGVEYGLSLWKLRGFLSLHRAPLSGMLFKPNATKVMNK